jgi:SWI/SNF-related matrix-associated actin-dependent regulator of chromatin subfamily A3
MGDNVFTEHCSRQSKTLLKEEYVRFYDDDTSYLRPNTVLQPHQKTFLGWARVRESLTECGCKGGFLLDEPGMGKTLQILSLIASTPVVEPTLIIVPPHLIPHWIHESTLHFQPGVFNIHVYSGNKRFRVAPDPGCTIILTSYGTVLKDFCKNVEEVSRRRIPQHQLPAMFPGFRKDSLLSNNFGRLVLDESHHIRNDNATSSAVTNIYAQCVWCISATPFMNRINDFYNQIKVLGISPYDDLLTWKSHILGPIAFRPITTFETFMQRVMLPFSIRRQKSELERLPSRTERIVWLDFNDTEEEFYTLLLDYTRTRVSKIMKNIQVVGANHSRMSQFVRRMRMAVNVFILRLKQACCHPELVIRRILKMNDQQHDFNSIQQAVVLLRRSIDKGLDEDCCICISNPATYTNGICAHCICEECSHELLRRNLLSCPLCRVEAHTWGPATEMINEMQDIIETAPVDPGEFKVDPMISSKVNWIMEDLHNHSEKVVIVSQWVEVLQIYAHQLTKMGFTHLSLDGRVPPGRRYAIVNQFQSDPNIRVCLLSLCSSSEGISLISASRIYHVDPWWNENKGLQASDRIHRIGQTKDVNIIHLRMKNSVEEAITHMQQQKSQVFNVVVGTGAVTGDMTWANNVHLMLAERERDACRANE